MAGRLSELRAAAALAHLIGLPLKPHQRDLIAPLAARDPAGGPGYAHPAVVVLAPRQVAKTTSTYLLLLARMVTRRGYAAAYTAQTGIVVTHVMANPGNGWLTLTDLHMGDLFRTSRSQGRETISARHNPGGYLKAFPPTPGRLRSNSLDCVVLDECQEHGHPVGTALLADTGPVFTTRPRRQLLLIGTAGAADSWWRAQYDRARAGDYGLVELGTWPADADIEDPAVWEAHHPGLRHGMTDTDHLRTQLAMLGPDRFAREYGNRWGAPGGVDSPITDAVWVAAQTGTPPDAPTALAIDAAPDGSAAVVVAAGPADGATVAGVADRREGTAWLVDAVAGMHRRHPRAVIVADPAGPAGGAAAQLAAAGVPVEHHTGAARSAAPAHMVSLLTAGAARVLPHPLLDASRTAAARRFTESGGWVWSRRASDGDISPLTAATMAVWVASRPPKPRPRAYHHPPARRG